MSVNLTPSGVPPKITERPIRDIAASTVIDPRIPALVPGFDAPFFQAGLAGYSDGAMRLIARRHGCPYCVTEALLDQTLINFTVTHGWGRGFRIGCGFATPAAPQGRRL